jgi:hypothetical protein
MRRHVWRRLCRVEAHVAWNGINACSVEKKFFSARPPRVRRERSLSCAQFLSAGALIVETSGVTAMCDYSLEMYASRPARESEKYTTTRFPSGSIGLSVPGDCTTAVCVQYDMRLKLRDISSDLQTRLDISAEEEVVFARLDHGAYRDGVKFANGKQISLQLLGAGVSIALVETIVEPQTIAEPVLEAQPAPTIIRERPLEPVMRSVERALEPVD